MSLGPRPGGKDWKVPTESGFLPGNPPRAGIESAAVRFVATAGVIGIGTAVGAILSDNNVAGWVVALVVSTMSVLLAAVLWRSRRL
jgi:hypothetical protein